MPADKTGINWQRYFFFYGTISLVIASLYFARIIILPIVLAILLAFVLNPVVAFLQRRGLGRLLSVTLVVGLATLVFVGLIAAVGYQATDLAQEIPKYRDNIVTKINSFRDGGGSNFLGFLEEIVQTFEGETDKTVLVRIQQSAFPMLQNVAGYGVDFLINVGMVLLLVIFMLLGREDLRNRFIGVCGQCNINTTTKVLDEASQRVSRFLGMQFLVNASYAATLGIGLFLLGVPFAFIWGLLSGLLRYIPYIGPVIGAMFPIIISFAIEDTWGPLIGVVVFIVVVELISNNLMEPWLYGRSIGVSEIGIIVSAAFWAWLWGPMGLILSTPITACLVVFGRYVPAMRLLPHFMGNEPVLADEITFYQRLLARDVEEANDLVETYIQNHPVETVYDVILLPALVQSRRFQDQGDIDREDRKYIFGGIRQIVDEVVEPAMDESHEKNQVDKPVPPFGRRVRIMGLAWEPAGETGLYLLKTMMDLAQCEWRIFSLQGGWGEALNQIRREKPRILVLGTMLNHRLGRARTLCRRIKNHFPNLVIYVHAWGQDNVGTFREHLQKVGAEDVAATFVEGWNQVTAQVRAFIENAEPQPAGNGADHGNGTRKTTLSRKNDVEDMVDKE